MPTNDELLRQYLDLITSQHVQKPRFRATVGLSIYPHIEAQQEACRIIGLYDLDTAVGQALDFTGQWIGLSRFLQIEAEIWFSLDTANLGFDEGRWMVPFEQQFNIIRLGDEDYRNLLRAKVIANYWDGTIPGAYAAWDQLFASSGYKMVIQDQGARVEPDVRGNMHVWQILFGPPLSQVTKILFEGGYLGLKSAGVGTGYMIQSQPDSGFDGTNLPMFAFDTYEEPERPIPPLPPGTPQSPWDTEEAPPPEPGELPTPASLWDTGLGGSHWDIVTRTAAPRAEYPDILFAGFDRGAWGQVLTSGITPAPPPPPPPVAGSVWDQEAGGSVWDQEAGGSVWDIA